MEYVGDIDMGALGRRGRTQVNIPGKGWKTLAHEDDIIALHQRIDELQKAIDGAEQTAAKKARPNTERLLRLSDLPGLDELPCFV